MGATIKPLTTLCVKIKKGLPRRANPFSCKKLEAMSGGPATNECRTTGRRAEGEKRKAEISLLLPPFASLRQPLHTVGLLPTMRRLLSVALTGGFGLGLVVALLVAEHGLA